MTSLVEQDCTGNAWAIFETPSGNVEVTVYEEYARHEALNRALVLYPGMPVVDSWFAEAEAGAEVILLGECPDPGEWL